MRLLLSFTALAALAGALVLGAAKAPQPSETLPERAGKAPAVPFKVPDFRLLDHTGASHQLSRYADAQAVVLVYGGNGCPIVRQSVPALNALRDTYTPRGVLFAMVNANSQDGREDILREAEEFAINMPILLDTGQSLTRVFGVDRTATALVILPETREVVFRGAINDRFGYGTAKPEASHHWLRDAIEAVLAGRIPNPAETDARGCVITLETVPEPTEISYARDIAPIIQNRCVTCHSEGSIGPFAFNRHKTVQGWRGMMREVILTKRMPPWHADPVYGEFANDAALTPDEERTLLAWLDAGAPRGDGPDPLPRTPPPAEEWPLGEPDIVVPLPREIRIPAEGNVEYLYIPVDSGLTEDVWVRAATVVPGNRRVLHHCLVFVKYPNELVVEQPEYRGGLDGYFAGYVPGAEYAPYPEGTGKFIPKGARLVFQLHYTPTGRPKPTNTKLGLYLHASKPVCGTADPRGVQRQFRHSSARAQPRSDRNVPDSQRQAVWALSPTCTARQPVCLRGGISRTDARDPVIGANYDLTGRPVPAQGAETAAGGHTIVLHCGFTTPPAIPPIPIRASVSVLANRRGMKCASVTWTSATRCRRERMGPNRLASRRFLNP